MNDASLHIDLGTVRSLSGELLFKLVETPRGDAHITVYAHDPTDARKSGVYLQLDELGYQKLKSILEYADCTIRRMQKTPRGDSPKLRISSNGQDLGELSVETVVFMLESDKLTLQDYYFDVTANNWTQLDLCPLLDGLF